MGIFGNNFIKIHKDFYAQTIAHFLYQKYTAQMSPHRLQKENRSSQNIKGKQKNPSCFFRVIGLL